MDQSVSTLFYPKKPKHYDGGPVAIYMRITVRKEGASIVDKKEMSTGKKVNLERWSSGSNRLTGRTDQVKVINDFLDLLEMKVSQSHNHLLRMEQDVTAEKIKLLVEGKSLEPERTILPVFKAHNDRIKVLIGKDYAPGTYTRYQTSYRHVVNFMKLVYKVDDYSIKQIDLDFLQKYELMVKDGTELFA